MAEYYYLVSSLPMLEKYAEPSMNSEEFVETCEDWLSKQDLSLLNGITLVPSGGKSYEHGSAAASWNEWEICLRNKLTRARGTKQNREVEAYIQDESDCFPEIDRVMQDVAASHNPLEAEKVLDDMRWSKLDELEACHDFDVNKLCAYKLKLQLCEKWMQREDKVGVERFNEILDAVNAETTD